MKTLNSIVLGGLLTLLIVPCYGQMSCCSPNGSCSSSSPAPVSNTIKYAKNGGTVRQAGKYYIEMVTQLMYTDSPVTFYLMNKKGKPMTDKGISGKAEFTFSDGTTETDTLQLINGNEFVSHLKSKKMSFVCLVTFHINDENVMTRFDYGTSSNAGTKVVYTCPMHPDIVSDIPGKCPKCGMDLTKKDSTQ